MIEARVPTDQPSATCTGCRGAKGAPIATILSIYPGHRNGDIVVTIVLCQECGRDVANAVGFMCIRDGGWSKLEPRKQKALPVAKTKVSRTKVDAQRERDRKVLCAATSGDGRPCQLADAHKREHRFAGIDGKTCTCMLRWYPNRCEAHPECNQ